MRASTALASALVLLLLSAFALATCGAPAHAQAVCLPYQTLADGLKQRYQEERIGTALTATGHALAIFASPGGKTWTMLMIAPNGPACIVSSGEGLDVAPAPPASEKS